LADLFTNIDTSSMGKIRKYIKIMNINVIEIDLNRDGDVDMSITLSNHIGQVYLQDMMNNDSIVL
jgi:hypothetical protein